VPGIVLQDEKPDQEEGGREVQGQGEEEGVVEGKVGQVEEAQKGRSVSATWRRLRQVLGLA
jgi:hypothetical protein